ncbi:orotidine-5'-phosphate decarboxylase [Treponema sp.]|uniref:orotidine-5'-phosphate decarboxylase n=1 Tax=Treponema sp. TaxID=166 RepID=UPI0025E97803|nr:orotidine-5'-phosphate decarboxylase [Treponema sp.]MCR5217950.1 orotidine-5'-phosphate decarboxylase [Treponema sp.]
MKHNMQILQELALANGPLCVGLDTDPSYIPQSVLKNYPDPADAVLAYNKEIISRVAKDKSACCFKVQIAYYEAMGLKGMEVYAQTLKEVKKSGLICISDIKRGDIAATASAYARAHFSGDFETDIITINPYMGFDTLKPFTEYCKQGKGIFVLLRTSNPGMRDIEDLNLAENKHVYEKVGEELQRIKNEFKEIYPDQTCSPVGAVIGCTEWQNAVELRQASKDIFLLIPGYGAQGGDAKICAALLQDCSGTVNSSRGILCAWKKDGECLAKGEDALTLKDIADAAARAAVTSKNDLCHAKEN